MGTVDEPLLLLGWHVLGSDDGSHMPGNGVYLLDDKRCARSSSLALLF